MRSKAEIDADLAAARAGYHEAAATESAPALAARSAAIKLLMDELDVLLCEDAVPCPICGDEPMGRLKTPSFVFKGRRVVPPVYAIQCISSKHKPLRAYGYSPKAAALLWNAEQFVDDEVEG